jgi:hypothetical protein
MHLRKSEVHCIFDTCQAVRRARIGFSQLSFRQKMRVCSSVPVVATTI